MVTGIMEHVEIMISVSSSRGMSALLKITIDLHIQLGCTRCHCSCTWRSQYNNQKWNHKIL